MTPGYKTTEFYVSLMALAIAGVVVIMQVYAGKLDSMGALGVLGAATALLYKRKRHAVKNAADETPPKPPSVPPAAALLIGLTFLAGCVVNVPQETADSAMQIRQDFATFRANVAPVGTDAATIAKTNVLGSAIDTNLELLSKVTSEGVKK